ncbi:putative P-loop containing nucleoside triphosphate hydrolase [Rosa chinensis]|uniref:Putative P-loop containing nucleoside triphosphate hydrolase n=1 Tax=Rosa chinensis TaxID=74649 RepID=A0A2P6PG32_ROSCH|nr:putative P-loop containing nucleoside triphosphate hydrolase [Rosa chinensis]
MESLIVSPLVEVLFGRLATTVVSEVRTRRGVKREIERMQEMLPVIQAVIEDAEEQQRKNKKVRTWLAKLKDVAVDADDLLDEVATLVLRKNFMKKEFRGPDAATRYDFLIIKLIAAQEEFDSESIRILLHVGIGILFPSSDRSMELRISMILREMEALQNTYTGEGKIKILQFILYSKLYVLDSRPNVNMKDRIGMILRKIGERTRYEVRKTSLTLESISTYRKKSRKLKEICGRLDDVAKEMSTFQFKETQSYGRSSTMERPQTGPSVNDSKVYGREEDVDKIVGMLLSSSSGPEVAVIPIVGIGGMGKTTLAQLVYNDPRVTSQFQSLMWVSVNDNFNPARIINQILSYVGHGSHDSFQIGVLQSQLRESLLGKRYLIVLDDVWNEDPDEWDKIMNPLKGSAGTSKIVLTTQSEAVAAISGTFPPFHLEPLTKKEC